ncbi:MAG TPA: FecR domain-containing protein [Longimicrobium sp.]|nr:FecR domain-containing protein [Longimicrobium sp.]
MDKRHVVPGTGGEDEHWEALARFLAGESPPAEADAVRAWLAERPERAARLAALDRAMDHGAAPAGLDVEAALARVHRRMDSAATPVTPLRRPAPPSVAAPRWRTPVLRLAAMVVLLLGALFAWQALRGGDPRNAVRTYVSGVGQRDSVRLSDGTRVLLGPGSRLTLAAGYGGRTREVELRGEALFDVPHDDARPFTVHAGGAHVRDIGTTFSVEADSGGGVRVVVTDGAVALRAGADAGGDEMVLRQGERGVLPEGGTRAQRAAATADDLAWTRGELVFRDASITDVAAEVRRWFGVELRAGDAAVAGRRLTASFQGEDRDQVLQVIALALGAEMTVRGDTAVLNAAPPGAAR